MLPVTNLPNRNWWPGPVSHLPCVNAGVIALLKDCNVRACFTPNLLAEVAGHHDEVLREFGTHRVLTSCEVEFPPPPLTGTATIVPLRTPWKLHEEGRQQGNCVGSYTEPVMAGKLYIYRVLRPQRATLSIGQGFDGNWQIQELLQSHDRPVSEATREHVESWVNQFFDLH